MADALLGGIVINEILADPSGATSYDTDGSGSVENTDEFIELLNTSAAPIDISGLQLWDAGVGNYFTFPPGSVLQPGAHALVITGVSQGGALPTGGPDDLFFDAGRGVAAINNGGDNVVVYDPANDEFIAATFNGDALDDPTLGTGGYSGFSSTATQNGAGENFGNDVDGQSLQRTPDGGDTFTSDTPTAGSGNVCFAQGTMFDTPDGLQLVEHIAAGDLITTMDHGPQQVTWVYAKSWSSREMMQMENLRPVTICAGAFGNGLPRRDLRVSQQHRVLVQGPIAQRMFGEAQVLVAAKHLTGLADVSIDLPDTPVTYYHVMFARHEVVFAEGLPTESLYLGAQSLGAIPAEGLREIEVLLGKSAADLFASDVARARPFTKGRRARALVRRHIKNARPLVDVRAG